MTEARILNYPSTSLRLVPLPIACGNWEEQ
jgi:hypothetical protein